LWSNTPIIYISWLIDASTRQSHICLLSTCNEKFTNLSAQLIKLRALYLDYLIKIIHLDTAGEFTSHAFHKYRRSNGIEVEHLVAHVQTQNGLAESLIKRIKLVARPLLIRVNPSMTTWGCAILNVTVLICIKPTSYHKYFIM